MMQLVCLTLIQSWLRENKKIIVNVQYSHHPLALGYLVRIDDIRNIEEGNILPSHTHVSKSDEEDAFSNYEDALERGIEEALKIIAII